MQTTSNFGNLTINLDTASAEVLARLLKRLAFADCRAHAICDEEAYRMQHAAQTMRAALAEAGIAVR